MAPFRTLLVATDFSAHSEAALARAVELARASGGEIHLLHAYSLPYGVTVPYDIVIPHEVMTGVRDAATAELEKACAGVREQGVGAKAHAVGSPAVEAILELAEALPADLIVVGTRGLTGVRHALLGSIAERVVQHAHCPVLTVKGEDA